MWGNLVDHIPTKDYLFVLIGANVRIGRCVEGCSDDGGRVLEPYGRHAFNDNGERLMLALTNTFSPHARVAYRTRPTAPALVTVSGSNTSKLAKSINQL